MFIHTFWQRYKYRIIGAAGLAVLYLCILGALWLDTGGEGERFGWGLLILDYPILLFAMIAGWRSSSDIVAVMFYGLGGTLQYALIGWLIGPILRIFVYDEPKQHAINNLLSIKDNNKERRPSDESE